MNETFRNILIQADLQEAHFFTAHQVTAWPRGSLAWLTKAKILKEAEDAEEILCEECEEGCQIKPDIRKNPRTGRQIGVYCCTRNEDVGRFTVSPDRMRQWAFSLSGLAHVVAKEVGVKGKPVESEPGRLVMLGTAKVDGKTRELFLARGVTWPDASNVFGNCPRLKQASHAAVLALVATPKEPLLAGCELAVRPLAEIVDFPRGKLAISLDGAFPDTKPGPWADIPNEPITLDQFMVKYCEKKSRHIRQYRRQALLAANRNHTVKMPSLAIPHKSGQSHKYYTHDLLSSWQGFLDEGVDLPPLLGEYKSIRQTQ
ncbi:MAG: hypothetical protein JW902_15510 [Syntrophaceae bacterium]|nr:hypothetical protein [Syntrophaceae bacterium]